MTREPVHELVSAAAERFADHTAIEWGKRRVTYRRLEEKANNLANFLIEGGVGSDTRVATLLSDPIEQVVAILGVLKAGGAFVPLDGELPVERLAAVATAAAPSWLLTESSSDAQLAALTAAGTDGCEIVHLDGANGSGTPASDLGGAYTDFWNPTRPSIDRDPDGMCYVYFTSGSTGRPKGILGRLRAIDHFVRWEIETFGVGEGSRVSQLTTPSFDAYLRDVFVPLCAGGVICVPESRQAVLDARRLAGFLDGERIHLMHATPSLWRTLFSESLDDRMFTDMRYVLLAGERLLTADVRRWTEVFGERIRLVNLYGPSETTMTKLFYVAEDSDRDRPSIPIGQPMRGARAVIVDALGQACPQGAVGEIYIRTPFRSLGYLDRPELTRQAFVPNPFTANPADLVYRTGDLGRILADGNFEFIGRRDQQVKIRGVRVELGEVEEALRRLPEIREAVVVDRDDASGTKYLCAYYVAGGECETEDLRRQLATKLSASLVPSAFVPIESVPRTPNGKLDRRQLPDPALAAGGDASGSGAPRTPLEEILAAIWCQLLDRPQVGRRDSFFALGGHSLLATQLLSRIRSALDVDLPLAAVFDAPHLAALATAIENATRNTSAPPPLVPSPRHGPLALSFGQERLWFLHQLDPGGSAYNVPMVLSLRGRFHAAAFTAALNGIVARHESLRTTFRTADGKPAQVIAPLLTIGIPEIDLRRLEPRHRDAEALRLGLADAERPFDLERGPLLRATLLRLADDELRALLNLHHIVSDGWSVGILMRELKELYRAALAGRPARLAALPIQYADFASWQRQWLRDEVLEAHLAYWREQLDGAPQLLDLPTDRPRPPVQTYPGDRRPVVLEPPLEDALNRLSRGEGATLFMTLLAAFNMLLRRYSGQGDVSIGTPVANREQLATEDLVGFFVNTLVLRARGPGRATFRELLGQVRETALGAYRYQAIPFEKLVEELRPPRSTSHGPFFQVMFVLHNVPRTSFELPELILEEFEAVRSTVRFDLILALLERGDGVRGYLDFNTDLFDPTTVSRMVGHYRHLLGSIARRPDLELDELALLGSHERHQLLVEANDSRAELGEEATLIRLFERRATAHPELPAVLFEGRETSYGDLDRQADHWARRLRAAGVGPEVAVAISMERAPEAIVAILAVLKAGGFYVPLEPSHPRERLARILDDVRAPVILTQERFAPILPIDDLPRAVRVWCLDAGEPDADLAAELPHAGPEHPAYVIFTSGSTGRPKGVVAPNRGLVNFSRAIIRAVALAPGERMLLFAPLNFDASALQLFPTLLAGATLVVHHNPAQMVLSEMLDFCQQQRITVLDVPVVIWRQWSEEMPAIGARFQPPLRVCMTGGEKVLCDWLPSWADLVPDGVELLSSYGPTEASVTATLVTVHSVSAEGDAAARVVNAHDHRPYLPLGSPLPNVEIRLLDGCQRPVPPGTAGDLYIGGAGVTRGYHQRPRPTAQAFCPDPFRRQPGARLYRTGDLGRARVGGHIEFLGRDDDQVKIRGFRIELGEIETVLGDHPGVAKAVCIVHRNGIGDSGQIVVYYQPEHGSEPSPPELRTFLEGKLPHYMVPALFMELAEIPMIAASGKVDRRSLPAPDFGRLERAAPFVAPRNPLEEVVAGIWGEVLQVERVGVDDNFFELGGHSLLATRIVSRLRDAFEVDLELRALFEASTVTGIAAALTADLEQRERVEMTAQVMLELAELSEEEAAEMLEAPSEEVSVEGAQTESPRS